MKPKKPFQRPRSFGAWSFEPLNQETKNEWPFIQGHRYNQKRMASKEKRVRKKTVDRRQETE
jgi:hypothetical protein